MSSSLSAFFPYARVLVFLGFATGAHFAEKPAATGWQLGDASLVLRNNFDQAFVHPLDCQGIQGEEARHRIGSGNHVFKSEHHQDPVFRDRLERDGCLKDGDTCSFSADQSLG